MQGEKNANEGQATNLNDLSIRLLAKSMNYRIKESNR